MPGHPECAVQRGPYFDEKDGDDIMTVFFSGCPGVDITVERVIRVNQNQLLWIQIRADDRGDRQPGARLGHDVQSLTARASSAAQPSRMPEPTRAIRSAMPGSSTSRPVTAISTWALSEPVRSSHRR